MAKFSIKKILADWNASKKGRERVHADIEAGVETPVLTREISKTAKPTIIVFPLLSEADACAESLPFWMDLIDVERVVHTLPETVTGERFIPENETSRARILNHALSPTDETVFVTSVSGLLSPTPPPDNMAASRFTLETGVETPLSDIIDKLVAMDYDDELECGVPGEFSRRGGILDIFSPSSEHPARFEFFGDELESIRLFDSETQRTFKRVDEYEIIQKNTMVESDECSFIDYFAESKPNVIIISPEQCAEHLDRFENDGFMERWRKIMADDGLEKTLLLAPAESHAHPKARAPDVARTALLLADSEGDDSREYDEFHLKLRARLAADRIRQWLDTGYEIVVSTPFEHSETLVGEWCAENKIKPDALNTTTESIPFGLTFPSLKKVVLTEKELLSAAPTGASFVKPPKFDSELSDGETRASFAPAAAEFADLEPGNFAVHFEYGICVYRGVEFVEDNGIVSEMFKLEFADDVTAYVPLSQAHMLSKYIGSGKGLPPLAKKSDGKWLKTKLAAAKDIKEMAEGLLRIQAMRLKRKGREFRGDPVWERMFERSFPYEETPDQIKTSEAVNKDMESKRPMDRLVCGDVGYGKTEIAMRAAFKAVTDGCQVAIMVPTTILAQQHYLSFTERFAAQPVTIEMLSRFKTPSEQKATLAKLAEGKLDIVIGTHRLAQKDVSFANLGLVIIDEEQRFGVRHKEKLKQFKATVDLLTLTATPIPRTLYMAMTGLRDMSAIITPPNKRMAVRTFICREDLTIAERAIKDELERGGQVYYLHNRVKTIERRLEELKALLPDAEFAVAHGQMDEHELEKVMSLFITGEIDVLVCTTIIESGLDIPNANTLIIDRADRFGLAELYQLRGRVGRWHRQAYAYLFLPAKDILTGTARKRLAAIRRYSELGSGFRLALRDLEIRGSGNLLGAKQSGHINAIGFELYCRLLRSAVAEESGKPADFAPSATVALDFVTTAPKAPRGLLPATLPSSYIPSERVRLGFFKKLANTAEETTLADILEEMTDRFGPPPKYVLNHLDVVRLGILCVKAGYARVAVREDAVEISIGRSALKIDGAAPTLKSKTPSAKLAELLKILRNAGNKQ
ncbi:MAG: transcription-repair coupling factor [Kiritimatiellaeota bacterium]|nr:transcription-repair coupling factor [Kiritimatiellota bacterium]